MIKKDKKIVYKINKKIIFLFIFVLICIIGSVTFSYFYQKEDENLISMSSTTNVSNKKIGWGLKRGKNGEQPDVGQVNKTLLDEVNGMYLGNKDDKYIYLTFDSGYEARIYR